MILIFLERIQRRQKRVYRSNILWTENVRQFLLLYHMCLWLTLISFITRTLFALSPLNKQKLNFLIDYIQSQSFLTGFLSLDSTWIFSIPKYIFCKLQFWWYKYGTWYWLRVLKIYYILLNSRKMNIKIFSHVQYLSLVSMKLSILKFNVQLVMSVAGHCMQIELLC